MFEQFIEFLLREGYHNPTACPNNKERCSDCVFFDNGSCVYKRTKVDPDNQACVFYRYRGCSRCLTDEACVPIALVRKFLDGR